jgi:hypothetical protein
MLVTFDCRISSAVMTKTADAVRESFCSVFDAEVISMVIKSSMLLSPRSFGVSCDQAGIVIRTAAAKLRQPRVRNLRIPDLSDGGGGRLALWIDLIELSFFCLQNCTKPIQQLSSSFLLPGRRCFSATMDFRTVQ